MKGRIERWNKETKEVKKEGCKERKKEVKTEGKNGKRMEGKNKGGKRKRKWKEELKERRREGKENHIRQEGKEKRIEGRERKRKTDEGKKDKRKREKWKEKDERKKKEDRRKATGPRSPSSSKKPRNRSIFHSLFCCLCHDETEPPPVNNNQPLLVEENGTITKAATKHLLPDIKPKDVGKICVVIDLDETLVHSSFKPVNNADFIIPVEIDGTVHQVYVLKRPHVDQFLRRMGELFECVLFTASLAKYADPVADLLDKWGAFRSRLFRESCVFHRGNYVKDLSRLGREMNKLIIIDNSPASYIFHPDNAVPVASWFEDMSDTELLDLIPFFERLSKVDDIYTILKQQRSSS